MSLPVQQSFEQEFELERIDRRVLGTKKTAHLLSQGMNGPVAHAKTMPPGLAGQVIPLISLPSIPDLQALHLAFTAFVVPPNPTA